MTATLPILKLEPGQSLNRWTVVKYERRGLYLCKCECGTLRPVCGSNLRSGNSTSCGCYKREYAAGLNWKHGLTGTQMHSLWLSMIARCECLSHEAYDNYGGRGIKVCERWHDFVTSLKDVGPRPSPKHSLDRIDNGGNYEPGNCRWATSQQQCRNTRRNRMITFKGRTLCAISWAEEVNKSARAIYCRLANGWSIEDALIRPVRITKARTFRS